jgi:DNA-binding MarR family transcriptional regulator
MVFLNERGMPPTLTDICRATGLPKSSVSRYIAWQIDQGLAKENVDPNDRRKRYLVQTRKGRTEWHWQTAQVGRLFNEIATLDRELRHSGQTRAGEAHVERMTMLTKDALTHRANFPILQKRGASKASRAPKG